jgi:hypothetical protein
LSEFQFVKATHAGYPQSGTHQRGSLIASLIPNTAHMIALRYIPHAGILEGGDVEEAIGLLMSFGDSGSGCPTGHERHIAFMWGYNSGAPSSCDGYIQQYW